MIALALAALTLLLTVFRELARRTDELAGRLDAIETTQARNYIEVSGALLQVATACQVVAVRAGVTEPSPPSHTLH